MRKRSLPISRAIVYFHLFAALIIILGVGFGIYVQVGATVKEYNARLVESDIGYVTRAIHVFLKHNQAALEDVSANAIVTQGVMHPSSVKAKLVDFLDDASILRYRPQFVLLDYQGRVIYATSETPLFEYGNNPDLKRLLGGSVERAFSLNSYDGEVFWRIAVPVYYASGVEGVLLVEIPFEQLDLDQHISERLGRDSVEFEVEGKVLSVLGNVIDAEPRRVDLPDISGGALLFRLDESGFRAARNLLLSKVLLTATFITFLLLLGVLWAMRRIFAAPLAELRRVAHSVSEGAMTVVIPEEHYLEEIALLARDFNQMAARVAAREDALERSRNTLELRVRERTQELHEALETVSERESVVRAMNEASHDALVMIDSEAVVSFWNPAAERLFGYTEQEAMGRNVHDLIAPEEVRDLAKRGMEAFAHSGTGPVVGVMLDFEAIRKDGSRILVERVVSSFEVRGKWYAVGSIRDITQKREIEQELQKLSLVAKHTDNSVIITDETGAAQWVNGAFERMSGYLQDEILGKKPGDVLQGPETDSDVVRYMHDQLEKGRGFRTEVVNYSKDGRKYWVSLDVQPVHDDDGVLTHFIAVENDVTQRRKMDAELRQAKEDADAANRAKSDFLARMSHEIRTPMNAVIGLGHLALKTRLTEQQQDYLQKMQAAAKSLLGVVDDILDFSKIEAGRLTLEVLSFNLRELIQDVKNLVQLIVEEKGLVFETFIDPETPAKLFGDPLRLRQVLTNLISNAVKFTERGKVSLAVSIEEVGKDDVRLRFAVMDTGIGMTGEQLESLFTSYYQAEDSTSRRFGGTGLGLVICEKLVSMMGGRIGVVSEPQSGSTFSFSLTFMVDQSVTAKAPAVDVSGLRIMIVDDSKTSREIVQAMLAGMDSQIFATSSGGDCLETLRTLTRAGTPVDLVILDWRMAGMDGIETARAIREENLITPKPKIIMLTAFGKEDARSVAHNARIDGFLDKPVNQSALVDMVVEVMSPEGGLIHNSEREPGRGGDEHLAKGNIEGARVLLVEDNAINQQVAREILLDFGLIVDVASNGVKAIEAVQAQKYDLVLMDIQMPEMDGHEAARRIRADTRFDEMPIVAMTAHALNRDRELSRDAGMVAHVTKPIDPEELLGVLKVWIKLGDRGIPDDRQSHHNGGVHEAGTNGMALTELPVSLAGIDIAEGVAKIGGKEKLYRSLLTQFVFEYETAVTELGKHLESGNIEDARVLAHTIKGVSGNLSMMELHKASETLERAIKEQGKDAPPEVLAEFAEKLDTVIQALRSLPGQADAEPITQKGELDVEGLRGQIARVRELLAKRSFTVGQAVSGLLQSGRGHVSPEVLSALETSVKKFDFAGAEKALAQIEAFLDTI